MSIIVAEKKILNQINKNEYIVRLRFLKPQELNAFEQLHFKLVQALSGTGILNANSRQFSCDRINQKNGFCLGGFVKEELISYLMVHYPKLGDENLGIEVGLSHEALLKVAHVDQTGVKAEYRGNKLTFFTRKLVTNYLLQQGVCHIFSTISPDNLPSLRNATQCHYAIVKIKEKYGGKLRCIMQYLPNIQVYPEKRIVFHKDYIAQSTLISKGWIGMQISKDGYISYFLKKDIISKPENRIMA